MARRSDRPSWLEGPGAPPGAGQGYYPGERLGRPRDGAGSVAGFGRRLLGLLLDWVIALLVARLLFRGTGGGAFGPLLVLLVDSAVLVGTLGSTIGHRAVGLRVETLPGAAPGLLRATARALLLCLAVPPLIWDRDQRGLHDRAAGTLVVRATGDRDRGR